MFWLFVSSLILHLFFFPLIKRLGSVLLVLHTLSFSFSHSRTFRDPGSICLLTSSTDPRLQSIRVHHIHKPFCTHSLIRFFRVCFLWNFTYRIQLPILYLSRFRITVGYERASGVMYYWSQLHTTWLPALYPARFAFRFPFSATICFSPHFFCVLIDSHLFFWLLFCVYARLFVICLFFPWFSTKIYTFNNPFVCVCVIVFLFCLMSVPFAK